jgi:tripartite-type tricarboxylate transporter receptor subunit TctC
MDLARTDQERAIFRLMFARQVMAWPFATPPGVPRDRVEALRKAFADTMKDKDFLADANKGNFEIRAVAGEDIQKLVMDVYDTPPAIAQKTMQLLQ